jgi:hypothetical protein
MITSHLFLKGLRADRRDGIVSRFFWDLYIFAPIPAAFSVKDGQSRMTRPQTKFEGPPKKTVWTVAWFAVLGIAVSVVLRLTRDSESADVDQTTSPWPEQIRLSEEEELSIPDPDELGKRRLTPRTPHEAIEDPSKSLCRFYRDLKTLDDRRADNPDKKVRILHYGDSILTTDELSGRVRRTLQRRFGDGGHGFVLLGKPWRWYHHLDIDHGANRKWTPRPLS